MPRTAFIGLSSPLAYDFKPTLETVHPRDEASPNPILEDAMGLMLFYDELVFLSRHLCPVNMRSLDFVSFLTDRQDFAEKFGGVELEELALSERQDTSLFGYAHRRSMLFDYGEAISAVTGEPLGASGRAEGSFDPSNFTPYFHLNDDFRVSGSSTDFEVMCYDWATQSQFGLEDADAVFNSANASYYGKILRRDAGTGRQVAIVHRLVARHLPNYLGPLGPYHAAIEELRSHAFVEDLRSYLDELVSSGDDREIEQVVVEMERLTNQYRDRVFRRHLAARNEYFTLAKAFVTDVAGLFVPFLGSAAALFESCVRRRQRGKMKWAGFVVEIPGAVA